jgi:ABC-2 type transport system permease protein
VEVLQVIVLVAVAGLLGWRPSGNLVFAAAAVLLATVAFAGFGLLMAGTLRGEVTLAAANGLYLVLLLLGGMVFPLDRLPEGLEAIAELLPAAALTQALDAALSSPASLAAQPSAVLVAWAVAAPALAAWRFRWE